MYTVLLVDDEPLVLEGLLAFLPWGDYGFAVAETADNGDSALAAAKRLHPDLIVTDVCMPMRDGIDFLTELRKNVSAGTKVIIFSGYDKFEYAHAAVELGVSAYLLKPIDREKFGNCLARLATELEKEEKLQDARKIHQRRIQQYCNSLYAGKPDSLAEIQSNAFFDLCEPEQRIWIASLGLELPCVGQKEVAWVEELLWEAFHLTHAPECPAAFIQRGSGQYALIFRATNTESEVVRGLTDMVQLLFEQTGWRLLCYLSGSGTCAADFQRQLQECTRCMQSAFYAQEGGQTVFTDRGDKQPDVPFSLSLPAALQALRPGAYMAGVLASTDTLRRQRTAPDVVRSLFREAARRDCEGEENRTECYQRFAAQVEQWIFYQLCRQLAALQQEGARQAGKSQIDTLEQVVCYVNEHYCEDVKLQALATQFYFNANYLGKALQQRLGMSMRDYLHSLRTRAARRLLAENRLTVAEVAARLGYRDSDSFAAHFKLCMGQSPLEYRKERLQK